MKKFFYCILILALASPCLALPSDGTGGWTETATQTSTDKAVVIGTSGPIVGKSNCAAETSGVCIDSDDGKIYRYDSGTEAMVEIGTGADGADAFVYVAYASADDGTGFTTTFNAALDYIAVLKSTTEIAEPDAEDFAGLWAKYLGSDGADGEDGAPGAAGEAGADGADAYLYVAYASADDGTGFSLTPTSALKYRAEIQSDTEIATPDADDFAAATWVKYIGDDGADGEGVTALNDIGDSSEDGTVAQAGYKLTLTSTLNSAGAIWTFTNTTADLTADVSFIDFKYTDDGDANGFFLRGYDNTGDLVWSIGADGELSIKKITSLAPDRYHFIEALNTDTILETATLGRLAFYDGEWRFANGTNWTADYLLRYASLGANVFTFLGTPSSANFFSAISDEGAYAATLFATTSESDFKQDVNLEIGVDVQAYDANNATASSSTTLTNKTLDAEGTGNSLTTVEKIWIAAAGCNNATAASFLDLPTANAAAAACITGTNTQKGVLDFDAATDESGQVTIMLPSDAAQLTSGGGIDIAVKWLAAATSGSVVWGVQTSCVATAETDDPSWNTATTATDAALGTTLQTNDAAIADVTATGCAAGELLHLRVYRDADNGADDMAGDARLIGFEVTYRRAQ